MAVGQDCSSNKLRCQEEAAVLAAFADEDPVVRERSQITLRKLEIRLQSQEGERQSLPRVLKELPAVPPERAEKSCYGQNDTEAIVGVLVGGNQVSRKFSAVDESSPVGRCDYLDDAAGLSTPVPVADDGSRKEGGDSVFASGKEDGEDETAYQLARLTDDADNQQGKSSCTERGVAWIESKSVAFRSRQQKQLGCPDANVWQSSEALASRSVMSQLQEVLTPTAATPMGGRGSCAALRQRQKQLPESTQGQNHTRPNGRKGGHKGCGQLPARRPVPESSRLKEGHRHQVVHVSPRGPA